MFKNTLKEYFDKLIKKLYYKSDVSLLISMKNGHS